MIAWSRFPMVARLTLVLLLLILAGCGQDSAATATPTATADVAVTPVPQVKSEPASLSVPLTTAMPYPTASPAHIATPFPTVSPTPTAKPGAMGLPGPTAEPDPAKETGEDTLYFPIRVIDTFCCPERYAQPGWLWERRHLRWTTDGASILMEYDGRLYVVEADGSRMWSIVNVITEVEHEPYFEGFEAFSVPVGRKTYFDVSPDSS